MVADRETSEKLIPDALELLKNDEQRKRLEEKIKLFAHINSADQIAEEVEKIIRNRD